MPIPDHEIIFRQETLTIPVYSNPCEQTHRGLFTSFMVFSFTLFREIAMDPLLGVNAYAPVFNYGSYGGISSTYPAYQLLASELSLSTPGSFSNTSTLVGLSGLGQVLSATATFQDQLHPLLPGGSAGGGSDLASLTAETQSFVDAYNNLQSAIASVNNTGDLLGGNVPGASGWCSRSTHRRRPATAMAARH